jgi:hypothetical protein
VTDFTLKSHLLEDYCQFGDGYGWTLSLITSAGSAVMISTDDYAAALTMGQPVDSSQNFYQGTSIMTRRFWGYCGTGILGEWLNLRDHYSHSSFEARELTISITGGQG